MLKGEKWRTGLGSAVSSMELGPRFLQQNDPELLLAACCKDWLTVVWPYRNKIVDYDRCSDSIGVKVDHVDASLVQDSNLKEVVDFLLIFTHT